MCVTVNNKYSSAQAARSPRHHLEGRLLLLLTPVCLSCVTYRRPSQYDPSAQQLLKAQAMAAGLMQQLQQPACLCCCTDTIMAVAHGDAATQSHGHVLDTKNLEHQLQHAPGSNACVGTTASAALGVWPGCRTSAVAATTHGPGMSCSCMPAVVQQGTYSPQHHQQQQQGLNHVVPGASASIHNAPAASSAEGGAGCSSKVFGVFRVAPALQGDLLLPTAGGACQRLYSTSSSGNHCCGGSNSGPSYLQAAFSAGTSGSSMSNQQQLQSQIHTILNPGYCCSPLGAPHRHGQQQQRQQQGPTAGQGAAYPGVHCGTIQLAPGKQRQLLLWLQQQGSGPQPCPESDGSQNLSPCYSLDQSGPLQTLRSVQLLQQQSSSGVSLSHSAAGSSGHLLGVHAPMFAASPGLVAQAAHSLPTAAAAAAGSQPCSLSGGVIHCSDVLQRQRPGLQAAVPPTGQPCQRQWQGRMHDARGAVGLEGMPDSSGPASGGHAVLEKKGPHFASNACSITRSASLPAVLQHNRSHAAGQSLKSCCNTPSCVQAAETVSADALSAAAVPAGNSSSNPGPAGSVRHYLQHQAVAVGVRVDSAAGGGVGQCPDEQKTCSCNGAPSSNDTESGAPNAPRGGLALLWGDAAAAAVAAIGPLEAEPTSSTSTSQEENICQAVMAAAATGSVMADGAAAGSNPCAKAAHNPHWGVASLRSIVAALSSVTRRTRDRTVSIAGNISSLPVTADDDDAAAGAAAAAIELAAQPAPDDGPANPCNGPLLARSSLLDRIGSLKIFGGAANLAGASRSSITTSDAGVSVRSVRRGNGSFSSRPSFGGARSMSAAWRSSFAARSTWSDWDDPASMSQVTLDESGDARSGPSVVCSDAAEPSDDSLQKLQQQLLRQRRVKDAVGGLAPVQSVTDEEQQQLNAQQQQQQQQAQEQLVSAAAPDSIGLHAKQQQQQQTQHAAAVQQVAGHNMLAAACDGVRKPQLQAASAANANRSSSWLIPAASESGGSSTLQTPPAGATVVAVSSTSLNTSAQTEGCQAGQASAQQTASSTQSLSPQQLHVIVPRRNLVSPAVLPQPEAPEASATEAQEPHRHDAVLQQSPQPLQSLHLQQQVPYTPWLLQQHKQLSAAAGAATVPLHQSASAPQLLQHDDSYVLRSPTPSQASLHSHFSHSSVASQWWFEGGCGGSPTAAQRTTSPQQGLGLQGPAWASSGRFLGFSSAIQGSEACQGSGSSMEQQGSESGSGFRFQTATEPGIRQARRGSGFEAVGSGVRAGPTRDAGAGPLRLGLRSAGDAGGSHQAWQIGAGGGSSNNAAPLRMGQIAPQVRIATGCA